MKRKFVINTTNKLADFMALTAIKYLGPVLIIHNDKQISRKIIKKKTKGLKHMGLTLGSLIPTLLQWILSGYSTYK